MGPVRRLPKSPGLTPLDFLIYNIKSNVYRSVPTIAEHMRVRNYSTFPAPEVLREVWPVTQSCDYDFTGKGVILNISVRLSKHHLHQFCFFVMMTFVDKLT